MLQAKQSFRYGEETISYEVRRQPERKVSRISIHVEPTGDVLVDAPVATSDQAIRIAVKKRARWIHGHVVSFRRRRAQTLLREYVSGESLMYLGRRYRLKVIVTSDEKESVRLWGGLIEVRLPTNERQLVSATLDSWSRSRAKIILSERLEAICATLRWVRHSPPIRFQIMKVQWGSCSPTGRLTLNPYLVKAPRECIDYVPLHELCHLKEHNHSAKFYKLLDLHLPQWQRRKQRLDKLAELILNR